MIWHRLVLLYQVLVFDNKRVSNTSAVYYGVPGTPYMKKYDRRPMEG